MRIYQKAFHVKVLCMHMCKQCMYVYSCLDLWNIDDFEDTSSQLAPLPPSDTPFRSSQQVAPGLKRAKSEMVLKKTPRSPNVLRKLPPEDAFTTIVEFLNTEERYFGCSWLAGLPARFVFLL
jgi:hypothetical protein